MTAAAAGSSPTLCRNASVSFSSRCVPAPPPHLLHLPTVAQAAAQQPVTADDVVAASITQLFYELDVEMIKATGTLSGCCCVAAAYAAPLMIVVSCGDCRSLFFGCPEKPRSGNISCRRAIFCGVDNVCHCMTVDHHPDLKVCSSLFAAVFRFTVFKG
jgi:hypothetical protein